MTLAKVTAAVSGIIIILFVSLIFGSSRGSPVLFESEGLTSRSNTSNIEYETYVNGTHRYSIDYPSDWEIGVPQNNTNLIRFEPKNSTSDGEDFALFFVEATNTTKYLDPQDLQVKSHTATEYLQREMNEIESLSSDLIDYDIVNQLEVDVGGTEGWKFDYIISMLGFQTGYGLEIYAVRNDTAYNLSFHTDAETVPKFLPIAEKMVNSFKILN